ncbi:MAG: YqzL family protein [Clostridiales bacterium]|nr:YqzL family protein [Clostridiales bacterium]
MHCINSKYEEASTLKELTWYVFAKTGSVSSYLLYKEIDNEWVKREDGRDYKASAYARGGIALHQHQGS